MAKHILSKSTFIRGTQCSKSLYLNRFFPALRDPLDDKRQAVFNRGHKVGDLARGLFPGGIDASPGTYKKTEEWVARTAELVQSGQQVIYEAAFIHNEVMVAVDILVREGAAWKAYEVKSSARISAVYLEDAALQYYVISGSGIPLSDFCLVHVNTNYVLGRTLDLQELFTFVPVFRDVSVKTAELEQQVNTFKSVIASGKVPQIEIGEHCHYPYPCDFISHCRKHLPASGTVFDLSGKSAAALYAWYDQGKMQMADLAAEDLDSRDVRIQVEAFLSGKIHVERDSLRMFIDGLRYPLVFLDFETFMPAIPVYPGTHPYEQIPFQFSAHIMEYAGAELQHADMVAYPGSDPRPEFTRELCKVLSGKGSILAYNATFERMIMKQCAAAFPEFSASLEKAIGNMADLMEPFKKKWFYHPAMKGSASIKQVLPALVPGLTYEGMKINNGAAAMTAYEDLSAIHDLFIVEETIADLKSYCAMDTLAMVKLLEVLISSAK